MSQGVFTYTYDAQGNMLTESDGIITKTYSYNANHKLTGFGDGTQSISYQYNPDGIRVSKDVDGAETLFIVDSNQPYAQVIAEQDASDVIQKEYVFGSDLISQISATETSFYHYDSLGTTRELSDSSGGMSDSYFYEAFGDVLAQTGSTDNDYKYTGEQFDAELDNYYLRARYYNQGVGRFTQMDSWLGIETEPNTLHKYIYVLNDPISFTDPSGHITVGELLTAINVRKTQGTLTQASFNVSFRSVGKKLTCVAVEEVATGLVVDMLTSGIYILQDGSKNYVGRTTDFERRYKQHVKDTLKNIEKTLARFHFEGSRNELRVLEQFFMDLFREAEISNKAKSIANNPKSFNSQKLRRMVDKLDICK